MTRSSNPVTAGDGDKRHGLRSTYSNHKCRCPACTAANALHANRYRQQAKPPPEGDPRHGTPHGYSNLGCRCPICTRRNTLRVAEYRAAKAAG